MRFTDFYSANSVCSPSRAALLTGCYPTRVSIPAVLFPNDVIGLNPQETTIAEMLKTKGYATACIGKWHLGHKPEFLPTQQGFDEYFGIPYSNDMWIDPEAKLAPDIHLREGATVEGIRAGEYPKPMVPLMHNEEVVEFPADQSTLTQRYTEAAIQFINKNRESPFFLYFPHTMPHIPLAVSEEFKGKSARGFYGDAIEEIDWSVGQIMKSLEELGLTEKTMIIFASDNGPWNLANGHGGCALPLRGFKFQTYEGGMRVPAIMRWPGTIPAGRVCSEITATIDLFPTIAHITGADLPSDRIIDGENIWPIISGMEGATTPHEYYYYYRGNTLEAVRGGEWKLRRQKDLIELYNLESDISEQHNLAEEQPDIVERLTQKADAFDKGLKETRRPAGQHPKKDPQS
jgi:arylsulfatase A-like enzyme